MKAKIALGLVIVWAMLYGENALGFSEGPMNSIFGTDAGSSNTGFQNTFIGVGAGHSNTKWNWNTFVGYGAGYSTDSYFNTFVGGDAGYNNKGGYQNTMIGMEAGNSNISGSGNVFLGYKAGSSETESNKLYIANSNTSSPLIYGEFDHNLLVINGVLSIASSREYKEHIDQLKPEKAIETLQHLNPVEFSYKATPTERHMGFISEEIPESMTARERKAVSPMDIVAVLTKVVQELKSENDGLKARNESLENRLSVIEAAIKASR